MNTKRLNIKLDGETHKALKRLLVEQDQSIQAFIVALIKRTLYDTPKP